MTLKAIPIANLQESGIDRLSGASPIAMNVVVNGKGVVTKRPCIAEYSGATSVVVDANGLDAIQMTDGGDLFAVGGAAMSYGIQYRNIWEITAGGAISRSGTNAEKVIGVIRPVIAETEALLVIAAGNRMQKIVKSTSASSALGGGPPNATHVISYNNRIMGNDAAVDQSAIRYSNPAIGDTYTGHETWAYGGFGTSGYFTAQAKPDPISSVSENANEVYLFGRTSLQAYVSEFVGPITSGYTSFAPVLTVEHGCAAPYSIIKLDQGFAWMDHRRRFIVNDGGTFEPISDAVQADLDDMGTVSDCFGYRAKMSGVECLVWTFPTDGRTFVFQKGVGWGQWSGWGQNWTRFLVNCAYLNPLDGETLVGTTDGRVGKLSMSAYDDLGDEVPAYVETGFQDHDTGKRKWCKNVYVHIRRGATTSSTAPVAYLSYADEPGRWSGRMPISLGVGGDTTTPIPLGPMGTYRTRAWKFEFSPTERLSLIGLEEEFKVLEV